MTAPSLAQDVRGKGRHYRSERLNALVPSVTNVIGVMNKPALMYWAAKVVAEAAFEHRAMLDGLDQGEAVDMLKGAPWRKSSAAGDRGDSVHSYLENRANGMGEKEAAERLSEDAAKYRRCADAFLTEWADEFVHVEETVFSDKHRYAGTGDFILWLKDGRLVLGDYKTSKAIYPEVALQLAALRYAERFDLGDGRLHPVPQVDDCIAVRIGPRKYSVQTVQADIRAFRCFLGLRSAWEWRNGDNYNSVVGPREQPPLEVSA